jgi:hypothetical protein
MQAWNELPHPEHRYRLPPHAHPVLLIGSQRTLQGGGFTCAVARSRPRPATKVTPASATPDARVRKPRRVSGELRSCTGRPHDPESLTLPNERHDIRQIRRSTLRHDGTALIDDEHVRADLDVERHGHLIASLGA